MLPKITHVFRLTRDPELKYTQSGTALCKVGLVASEKYKDKETTLFVDATAFGKTAEFLNNVSKGQRVFVAGRLQTDEWQDQTGQKRSKTTMTIENFEYVEKREDGQRTQHAPQYEQQNVPAGSTQDAGRGIPQNTMPGIDVSEETIPF
jgi:single-strand DNA-binding protein